MSEAPAPAPQQEASIKDNKESLRDNMRENSGFLMGNLRGSIESRNDWVTKQEERDRNLLIFIDDTVRPACRRVENVDGLRSSDWYQEVRNAVHNPIQGDAWTFLKEDVRPSNSNLKLSAAREAAERMQMREIPDSDLPGACGVVVEGINAGHKLAGEADQKLEEVRSKIQDRFSGLMRIVESTLIANHLYDNEDANELKRALDLLQEKINSWGNLSREDTNTFYELTAGDGLAANRIYETVLEMSQQLGK